ncbi:histone deacetylase 7 isoform X7 [Podarcis raffonei]|uniref:histone deacetylase 7 isoform X7 n=1 Tax=Podarcis raffonei TaxID=65483 RepID=UPI0023290C17|nr:histone deacetylase 7 isoform X7 [Podarcis raffonei]
MERLNSKLSVSPPLGSACANRERPWRTMRLPRPLPYGLKGRAADGEKGVSADGDRGASSQAAVKLCVSLRVPQTIPMDLRIGQRLAKPGPDTALLALKQTQQLQHQLFLASLHPRLEYQQVEQLSHQHLRVSMEPPPQDPVPGKQEQELRLLLNKDKSKRSAVASMVVKQKLAEVILKKQQAALERTNAPVITYRSLEPMEHEGPSNPALPSFFPPVSNSSGDSPEHFPLRKTASEPNLKLRYKTKKAGERRKNPLTRKESAPPSLKRRPAEAIDSSPSSSSTPVSGCSSPNDSLVPEHGALPAAPGLAQETPLAQRLRMQESSLAQFALQTTGSLPALTLGLPTTSAASARGDGDHRTHPGLAHKVPVLTSTHAPIFLPTSLEQHEPGNPLSTRLQPVIILEPSLPHSPLVTVPGLGTVPFHFSRSQLLPQDRLSMPTPHKPLGRTRSEPLPSSPRAVQQQLAYQQHHALFLERLKQQTQLGKRMAKSSEKPRLQQIPSSEDMEAEAGEDPSDPAQAQAEPLPAGGSSSKETESRSRLGQPQEEHVLQQAQYVWEQQQRMQQQQLLRRHPDSPLVSASRGSHRPLSRAHSSPAPATVSHLSQDTSSKAIPLPVQEQSNKPRFTTGIVYDSVMLKHQCSCGDNSNHPEHAGRIQSIWSRLQERGLRSQCECLRGRKATLEELQSVHTERHVLLYGTNPLSRLKLDNGKLAGILSQRMFVMLPCGGVGDAASQPSPVLLLFNLLRALSLGPLCTFIPLPSPCPYEWALAPLPPPPAPCTRREREGEREKRARSSQAEGGFCSHMELIRRESLRFSGSYFADDVILIKPRCLFLKKKIK